MSAATILTLANGKGIDLLNPKPEDVDFDAYAEQLAKEARYNGATPGIFYSVAEHAARGASAILAAGLDASVAAYFLLHDNHEAVLKDDTTPKKRAIAEIAHREFGVLAEHIISTYDLLTYRHDVAIHSAAGLAWPPSSQMQDAVKLFDLKMFVTEWRDLMAGAEHPNWEPYANIEPLREKINPMDWQTAKLAWMRLARDLLPSMMVKA